jgi:hypothetical protein
VRALQKALARATSRRNYGRSFSEVTPVKDYNERTEDVVNAIRALRRMGMRVGLPHQTADGVMFFQLDDYTLTVTQILELLDQNRLDREGIRALAEAQKKSC